MLRDIANFLRYRASKLGRRVDRIWNDTTDPILVCAMSIRHSIVKTREDLEIVVSGTGVVSHHRTFTSSREQPIETRKEHSDSPQAFASKLRSIGILDLTCSSDMGLFDGSWATVASRDTGHRDIFSDHSIETRQAEATSELLDITRPENYWAEHVTPNA